MPRKSIIDYKRYYVFKNGKAYCVIPGCSRPDWGYSMTGSNTKSMLKHMQDKHPTEYEEGIQLQAGALAQKDVAPSYLASVNSETSELAAAGSAPADASAKSDATADYTFKPLEEDNDGFPPIPPSPPMKVPRRRIVVDFSSEDEEHCLDVKLSSTDEQPGPSKSKPKKFRLSEVRSTATGWNFFNDELKKKLEKLSASLAAPTHSQLSDHAEHNLGIALAGDVNPAVDVGDAVVPQVQCLPANIEDEEEADWSSGDEVNPSNGTGADKKLYVVQKILRKRVVDGEVQLLTKWKGFRRADWQPLKNFDKSNAALMEFELKNATTVAESTDDEDDNINVVD